MSVSAPIELAGGGVDVRLLKPRPTAWRRALLPLTLTLLVAGAAATGTYYAVRREGSPPSPPLAVVPLSKVHTMPSPAMCSSPGGDHPCECLHVLPTGTKVEEKSDHVMLTFPNGTVKVLDACPHEHNRTYRISDESPEVYPPHSGNATSGRHLSESSSICPPNYKHAWPMKMSYTHSQSIGYFSTLQTVPDYPVTQASQWLYYWIGLQAIGESNTAVLQPVLSWRPSTKKWEYQSWNCCPQGHKFAAESVDAGQPGDVLTGSVTMAPSDGPHAGSYVINSTTSAGTSSLISTDVDSGFIKDWNWVIITFESYSANGCDQYSKGGSSKFHNMQLVDTNGIRVKPPPFSYYGAISGRTLSDLERTELFGCCSGCSQITWPNGVLANQCPLGSTLATAAQAAPAPNADKNSQCAYWARETPSKCAVNPLYMLRDCQLSCANEAKYGLIQPDKNSQCAYWAAETPSQCTVDPSYMSSNCQTSCDGKWS